jgi:hypothetical protein
LEITDCKVNCEKLNGLGPLNFSERSEESSYRLNYKLLELIMGKHHHSGKSRIISEPEIVTDPGLVKKLIHELWYILNFSTQ